MEIDWNAEPVMVKMQVRDLVGNPVSGTEVPLTLLQPGALHNKPLKPGEIRRHCTLEVDFPWLRRYLIALSFFSSLFGTSSSEVLSTKTQFFQF
jgi:alkaline phosphatase D